MVAPAPHAIFRKLRGRTLVQLSVVAHRATADAETKLAVAR